MKKSHNIPLTMHLTTIFEVKFRPFYGQNTTTISGVRCIVNYGDLECRLGVRGDWSEHKHSETKYNGQDQRKRIRLISSQSFVGFSSLPFLYRYEYNIHLTQENDIPSHLRVRWGFHGFSRN